MRPYVSAPQLSSSTSAGQGDEQGSVPDLLGHPEHQSGVWGMWLRLTTPGTHGGLLSRREREHPHAMPIPYPKADKVVSSG